ncbi:FkbM family methyltransferase [Azospirillum lipoferum]|uniref:FkbM family methyltransferase n=1 Tax=Azospirillum lipoferum TaxID=193 RepID=A0A5A9GEI2_AZOLI|nr:MULTISPECIES: FkbM family methyltransferase [Azospirillum]KAA0592938.1 FkbM family methyltransferase [Azospirillum lipoferum]MCP1614005.1 FkbM family methyltransferase [Azospirillum lipoferum]MDW5537603.1 FkbM family methyltransferase [Azospirillum sp. NL1]
MTAEALLKIVATHISGNLGDAQQEYKKYLKSFPGDPIATALFALVNGQSVFTRMSKHMALAILQNGGFNPATVFDVGAQFGTPPLINVFPHAHHVMFEPVAECEHALQSLCAKLKSAEYHMAAVTAQSGPINLWISKNRLYSTIGDNPHEEGEVYRTVNGISLNDIRSNSNFKGPYLVKVDVDGAEIEVLKGATSLITKESVFVVEATLLDENPRFSKIINFFEPFDFIPYDVVDFLYRPADSGLWQVDLILVHKDSPYRALKTWNRPSAV